jgi:hypothetical protein
MTQELDETTARVIGGTTTEPQNFRHGTLPDVSLEKTVRQGATSRDRWQPEPNRRAGQRELIWFEAHRHELADHERRWIAITGQDVRVARDTFAEVRTFLDQEEIANALIVFVRENVGERELFID